MAITASAQAAGFTHVKTMAGPVPIEQFHLRDAIGMTYADGVIYSPWRSATSFEASIWEQDHPPMIGLQARDSWACSVMAQEFLVDGERCTRTEILEANADQPDVIAWVQGAKPGDQFRDALVLVECVAAATTGEGPFGDVPLEP